MNDKTKQATPAQEDKTKPFTVVKEFWLGNLCFAKGSTVQLTDSQAKRLGEAVAAA